MPLHLRIFEWLMYGSIAVQAVQELPSPSWNTFGMVGLLAIIAVLTWAVARRGQTWPTLLLLIFVLVEGLDLVGGFWSGAPAWMRPTTPKTSFETITDAASALLALAALAFYFIGNARAGKYSSPPTPKTSDGIPQTVPLRETCANCRTPLVGLYCHNCSQSSASAILDFREGLSGLIYGFLKVDHKLLRTLQLALLSPGKLSLDFRNGIQVPYTPPLRFIFVLSISVLLVLAVTDIRLSQTYLAYGPDARVTRDAKGVPVLQNVNEYLVPIGRAQTRLKPPPEFLASLERELAQEKDGEHASQLRYWQAVANGDPKLTRLGIGLPIAFLAVAPLFAGLLMPFFLGKRYRYADHLVFAIHLHSVALLFLLVAVPVIYLWPSLLVLHVMGLYSLLLVAYIVVACRTFYGASWPASIAKGLALGAIDSLLIYFAIVGLDLAAAVSA